MNEFLNDKIINLFLFSSQGGPRLKGQELVAHFMKVIKEPQYNCHIGIEYCKLLKNTLSIPVYKSDVSVKTFQGMYDFSSCYKLWL